MRAPRTVAGWQPEATAREALQRSSTSPTRATEGRQEPGLDDDESRPLRCRACGAAVTSDSEWVTVDGRRVHHRTNPFGFEFEFGCFRSAPGARSEGRPTSEHTWFPGFTWVFALCRTCGFHLGWHFQGAGPPFHALILAALARGGDGD